MTDSRFQRLEDKLDKLTDAVSELHGDMKVVKHTLGEHDASLGRLEESVKSTRMLLEKHDAKATTALLKAQEVERDLTEVKAFWTVPLKWAKVIGIMAGAASALFGVWKLLGGLL